MGIWLGIIFHKLSIDKKIRLIYRYLQNDCTDFPFQSMHAEDDNDGKFQFRDRSVFIWEDTFFLMWTYL